MVTQLAIDKQGQNDEIYALKQQILELKEEILNLKTENSKLQSEIETQTNQSNSNNQQYIFKNSSSSYSTNKTNNSQQSDSRRCKAITQNGTQCSRQADAGSDYCWQHKSTYDPNNSSSTKSDGSTYNGKTIHTGPRGGQYYINSHGNKTYIKRK
jgi:hypothetical protein